MSLSGRGLTRLPDETFAAGFFRQVEASILLFAVDLTMLQNALSRRQCIYRVARQFAMLDLFAGTAGFLLNLSSCRALDLRITVSPLPLAVTSLLHPRHATFVCFACWWQRDIVVAPEPVPKHKHHGMSIRQQITSVTCHRF